MKRSDLLTNIIALLLFGAFVAYVFAYAVRNDGGVVTAEAVAADFAMGGSASGIIIRDETVLTSDEKYIDVTATDGARVAAGTLIANTMSSETGLERANRIHQLETEIARMSAALQQMDSAQDITGRNEALVEAVNGVASSVATHDLDSLDEPLFSIRSLLLGSYADEVSEQELSALQAELDSLRGSSSSDTEPIYSAMSGTFSSVIDGYEHLSPDDLSALKPSDVESLTESYVQPQGDVYGKLVTDFRWYFASVMSAKDAANLQKGSTVTLNFGRYYGSDVCADVVSISEPEDKNVAVVFRCSSALSDTIAMRSATASVVFEEYHGIRIPSQAVRTDEDKPGTYVWTVTAMQAERKDIDIIYAGKNFVIVSRDSGPDALREGNTVVVQGRDIYEGKVLQ